MRIALTALVLFFHCYFVSHSLAAQSDKGNPAAAEDLDLPTQFQQMVDESNRYQRFKVVPSNWLAAYKVNLTDSLAARTARAGELQSTIDRLEDEVANQSEQIAERDATIVQLNEEKDGISFLGANLSKGVYNTMVWGLVAALLAGLLFFLARGRYAVSVSRELESNNAELTAELEKSKRRRLEMEQDLRRKLQDERNKNSNS